MNYKEDGHGKVRQEIKLWKVHLFSDFVVEVTIA